MCFFFFNDTATTEIYTLSLHDALPIYPLAGLLRERLDEASPDLVALPDKGADEDLLLGALDLLEHRLVEPHPIRVELERALPRLQLHLGPFRPGEPLARPLPALPQLVHRHQDADEEDLQSRERREGPQAQPAQLRKRPPEGDRHAD